jgi:hypothetical protein
VTDPTTTVTPATTSDRASSAPESVAATADALYGESGKADGAQNQQAAETAKAGEPTSDKTDAPTGAPEKYEFKAIEGYELDSEVTEAFSEVARKLNLTQDAAQEVLDRMGPKMAERQKARADAVFSKWEQESKADTEFGGDALDANLGVARKALDQFGTPELRTLLNESRLGSHPAVIRLFYRVGRAISEDGFVGSSSNAGRQMPKNFNDAAAALYSTPTT